MTEPFEPAHGTLTRYTRGCRGEDCNGACPKAAARYAKRRTYDLARGRPRLIPNLGSRRRIQALAVVGWPLLEVAQRLGYARGSSLHRAVKPGGTVRADTAAALAKVYDELCMIPGPSSSTRKRAMSKGWAPPLAWGERDIDDPNVKPHLGKSADPEPDPVVVQRILAGDILPANRAERTEIVRRWPGTGLPLNELQRRFPQWNVWRDLKQIEKEAA